MANIYKTPAVNSHCSSLKVINSGEPQGWDISPTLFLYLISEFFSCTFSSIHSYAEKSTLYYPIRFQNSPSQQLLIDLMNLAVACLTSDLSLISELSRENLVVFISSL